MGSLGYTLTNVEMRLAKETTTVLDYLKFLIVQKELWETYADCYCFNQQAHFANIARCVLANNDNVVWYLELKIFESVRN
jgi:hypothetical protein